MPPDAAGAVMELLGGAFTSACVGAALELGLFWVLEEEPLAAEEIARRLRIRQEPCVYWLQLLTNAGFLDESGDLFCPSALTRTAIVEAYGPGTWALLAQEARERLPVLLDLPAALRAPRGVPARPDYVSLMQGDPERARRFTRMLYELHREAADALAVRLDLAGPRRVLDVGGGSGVVSLALADRNPDLAAVVVDIENVCAAGRELARERGLAARVTYQPGDVTTDALPDGFDLALMCDVGIYSTSLFRRIAEALMPGGRIVVADAFAPAAGVAPRSRVHWALERALTGQAHGFIASDVEAMLGEAGFQVGPRIGSTPEDSEMATVLTAELRATPLDG